MITSRPTSHFEHLSFYSALFWLDCHCWRPLVSFVDYSFIGHVSPILFCFCFSNTYLQLCIKFGSQFTCILHAKIKTLFLCLFFTNFCLPYFLFPLFLILSWLVWLVCFHCNSFRIFLKVIGITVWHLKNRWSTNERIKIFWRLRQWMNIGTVKSGLERAHIFHLFTFRKGIIVIRLLRCACLFYWSICGRLAFTKIIIQILRCFGSCLIISLLLSPLLFLWICLH